MPEEVPPAVIEKVEQKQEVIADNYDIEPKLEPPIEAPAPIPPQAAYDDPFFKSYFKRG